MRTRRQNIQLELALEPVAKGEARSPDTQGTEARTTHAEPERPETPSNRRVRTRTHGGVGGEEPRGSPLSRLSFPALKSEACRFEGQCLKKVVPEEEEESDETDAGSGWITRTTKFCTWR